MKTKIKNTLLLALLFSSNFIFSQPPTNMAGVANAIGTEKTSIISIIGHIAGILLGVAFVITLWKVASGKQDSKEQLMGLGGGLLVYFLAILFGFI